MDRSPNRNPMGLHTVVPKTGGVPDQTRSALPFDNLAEAVQENRLPRADRIPTPRPIRCNVYAVLKLGQRTFYSLYRAQNIEKQIGA